MEYGHWLAPVDGGLRHLESSHRHRLTASLLTPSSASPAQQFVKQNDQSRFTKSAEQGNPFAQNSMGVIYANGKGTEVSYSKAREWFEKAAEQGYPPAQRNLGMIYENGHGVETDNTKARYWYAKAAKQGDNAAQRRLNNLRGR